mmetsp:Transcript_13368/g.16120  ORF Transcript_13368/g.16120 Transcript_13368/m.16120 type:complete len:123 (-) Transcript_13368:662-1030(-)|eukprot:CAMPEP_0197848598 /NCGR_PEP_ID=MMETSP1438-20131217/9285_1 /TAXON_ID=1461541 /ORGANISM="Pterosperma sp., Strain CCMP1384" /LENGTH=122 /DNA_ID=CAMNT_0043460927 /DNA_START=100 /DNA_END=468 /DNA_ORIENTATION=-
MPATSSSDQTKRSHSQESKKAANLKPKRDITKCENTKNNDTGSLDSLHDMNSLLGRGTECESFLLKEFPVLQNFDEKQRWLIARSIMNTVESTVEKADSSPGESDAKQVVPESSKQVEENSE